MGSTAKTADRLIVDATSDACESGASTTTTQRSESDCSWSTVPPSVQVPGYRVDGIRQPDARFAVERQSDLLEQRIVAGDRDDVDASRRSRLNTCGERRYPLCTSGNGRRGQGTLLLVTGIGERRPPYPVTGRV